VNTAMGNRKRDLLVRLRSWSTEDSTVAPGAEAVAVELDESDDVGWVVHLAVDVPDLLAALAVAERLCIFVDGVFPQVVAGVTTVSRADDQAVRHHVFCDRLLPDHITRCGLRHLHRGPCTPR
jgi:hypothetical protein